MSNKTKVLINFFHKTKKWLYVQRWQITIVSIACLIRFVNLGEVPAGIYWDEASLLAESRAVAQMGTDTHGNPWWQLIYPAYGDYKLAPYIWSTSIMVKMFGASIFSLRLTSALAGVLIVIWAGLIAKRLLDEKWQLMTMLMMALAPWSIIFSRTAFEGHFAGMLLVGAAYFLIKAWQEKRFVMAALLSGIFAALSLLTYFSVRFVWPVIFLLLSAYCLYQLFYKKGLLRTFKDFQGLVAKILLIILANLIFFAGAWFCSKQSSYYQAADKYRLSTPSVINQPDLPLQVNVLREKSGDNFASKLIFNQKTLLVTPLLQNLAAHFHPNFLFLDGDTNLRHSTGMQGLLLLSMAPLLIYGLYKMAIKNWLLLIVLLGWWGVGLLPASVPMSGVPHALRSLNSLVPLILLTAYGAREIFWSKVKIYRSLLIAALALEMLYFNFYYHQIYPQTSREAWQTDYLEASKKIAEVENNYDRIYLYKMRYFMLWPQALTDFDISTLSQMPQKDFNFLQVGKFQELDWHEPIPEEKPRVLLVGEKQQIIEYFQGTGHKFEPIFEIPSANDIIVGVPI